MGLEDNFTFPHPIPADITFFLLSHHHSPPPSARGDDILHIVDPIPCCWFILFTTILNNKVEQFGAGCILEGRHGKERVVLLGEPEAVTVVRLGGGGGWGRLGRHLSFWDPSGLHACLEEEVGRWEQVLPRQDKTGLPAEQTWSFLLPSLLPSAFLSHYSASHRLSTYKNTLDFLPSG